MTTDGYDPNDAAHPVVIPVERISLDEAQRRYPLTSSGDNLVDLLDRHLIALSGRLGELVGHPGAQVVVHRRLAELRRNLAVVVDEVERLLLDELPERVNRVGRVVKDRLVVDGVGVVEPIESKGSWYDVNWSAMLVAVFGRVWPAGLVDRATGETVPAGRLAEVVLEVLGPSYMKASKNQQTGLYAYGLTRADFASWRDGEPGVKVIYGEGTS